MDRWYRRKYQIGFGTAAHLELCQINILLEYLEEEEFKAAELFHFNEKKNEKELNDGIWIRDRVDLPAEDKLFDQLSNIDLNTIQY